MPAHRRPRPPAHRAAIGVIAAVLVGGAGLGLTLTGNEQSHSDQVPAVRGGDHASRSLDRAAEPTVGMPPVSATATDTKGPTTPAPLGTTSAPAGARHASPGTVATAPSTSKRSAAGPTASARATRTPTPTPTSSGPAPTPTATPASSAPATSPAPTAAPTGTPTPLPSLDSPEPLSILNW